MSSWAHFLDFLMEWQPAVGLPEVYDYANVLGQYYADDGLEVRSVNNFDHLVIAVHADASQWLLPYVTELDNECQWVSQWRFTSLANALFPENTLLTHKLSVRNPNHAGYSKERCLELMLNVTLELRKDFEDFQSCFLEPSNKALVVDGVPRLMAYLPWFSASKRHFNYSEPRPKSCDDQPVVKATVVEKGNYSWCHGCHISVAFAVLQTIISTRRIEVSTRSLSKEG